MSINKTLREKGYSWEQIETFWDECITEAKQRKKVKNEKPD